MRCERIALSGEPKVLARQLRSLVPAPESVSAQVGEIIAAVRARGDQALAEYTRTLDSPGAHPPPLQVTDAELERAAVGLQPDVRAGLQRAIGNVRRVAEAGIDAERTVDMGAHRVTLRSAPVARAAVYVPGGRAPYPSTAVMGVVTASVAGVREVVVCSPPSRDGVLSDVVLAACTLAGGSRVYRMGGAQAVAALAYGTESIAPVDVVVGPGNLYVQEAKRQLSAHVGIDGFAGPSDLVVIIDGQEALELAALDLLAQSEHGSGTLVVALSSSARALDRLAARLGEAPDTGAVAAVVDVEEFDQALALVEALAPEHLELIGAGAEALAPGVTRAGCLFVGAAAATAFGDYVAGSNHILPTGGTARFASGLSPANFQRRFAEVRVEDPRELATAGAPLARAEGFELHAQSMEARIRENR